LRYLSAVLLALGLVACDSADKQQMPPAAVADVAAEAEANLDPAKGIDWFPGSVDDAFALAKESGKPVYLYWGAAWCPPCHAISATIFKSPEFVERSRLFVPVYLDGDTEDAQAYGEKFGVLGYPTMIVFDSGGAEITRIPGGIDLQAYANILDLTLANASSASTLVASLPIAANSLAGADCTLLAYYSWEQDTTILAARDEAATFRNMYEACPSAMAVERSMLYTAWLDAVISAADSPQDADLSDEQKLEARQQLAAMLDDDQLVKANIFAVEFGADDFLQALTSPDSAEREQLRSRYVAAFDRIAADESVYKRERIYTLTGRIGLERVDNAEAELSAELQQQILDMVQWADSSTPSIYERQPIINALANVLRAAGMHDKAKELLLAELDKSQQPYYFMVDIADIEQRAGNFDAALSWFKRAYDASQGPATRFQWGYYYLVGLLEMQPDNSQAIHDTAVGLISELQNSSGFYQRPKAQLARLQGRMIGWSEENGKSDELAAIRNSVLQVCASARRQDASRAICEAFLDTA